MIGFYWKFILNFVIVVFLFIDLMRKRMFNKIKWIDDFDYFFKELKGKLLLELVF